MHRQIGLRLPIARRHSEPVISALAYTLLDGASDSIERANCHNNASPDESDSVYVDFAKPESDKIVIAFASVTH